MTRAEPTKKQLHSDTISLFLSNATNRDESVALRAKAVKRCAKALTGRTSDKPFNDALKTIRNQKNDEAVCFSIEKAESSYWFNKSLANISQ